MYSSLSVSVKSEFVSKSENPKIAFIDLLSNVLVVTANKGSFWGGERRFYGGNPRQVKPFGDTSMLASGDYKGYMDSLMTGLTSASLLTGTSI